jgi:mRNA interferase YafQ
MPDLRPVPAPRFVKDLKRQEKIKTPEQMAVLQATIDLLCRRQPLPENYREHKLKGEWKGCFECHIGGVGDWLLVYRRFFQDLQLVRVGKHEDIFK